jgi:hypothetical protein
MALKLYFQEYFFIIFKIVVEARISIFFLRYKKRGETNLDLCIDMNSQMMVVKLNQNNVVSHNYNIFYNTKSKI